MLEQCDFMELTEEVLQQCKSFTCKDEDITEFFTHDYADYTYQLLGKSYCFVKPDTYEIVCAFTVANSSVKVDSLPSSLRNKLNRKIPNAKRKPQYPAVLVGQLAVSDSFSGYHIGSDKEEWAFLHYKDQEPTTSTEPIRTRLMYFDLIYLRTK